MRIFFFALGFTAPVPYLSTVDNEQSVSFDTRVRKRSFPAVSSDFQNSVILMVAFFMFFSIDYLGTMEVVPS